MNAMIAKIEVQYIHTISCQTLSIFLHYHWIWTVGVDVQNHTIFVHILNNCKIIWQMILPKVLKWQRILPCRQTNWKRFSMKKHAVLIGPAAILCTIWPSHLDSTDLKNSTLETEISTLRGENMPMDWLIPIQCHWIGYWFSDIWL